MVVSSIKLVLNYSHRGPVLLSNIENKLKFLYGVKVASPHLQQITSAKTS